MSNERIFLSPPHMCGRELELIKEAFASNYLAPVGPMIEGFEREFASYTGMPHCLAVSSGTAALHLALREAGVGPGDEVFASTLTFIGSVTPATFLGARPVFIDADRRTWNMDTALLERELRKCADNGCLPKAVVPTDLYGQCCDLPRIVELCDRYGVPVVCDSAEAVGARYRRAEGKGQRAVCHAVVPTPNGRSGEGERSEVRGQKSEWVHAGYGAKAAVYSFNGNKIITASGGGMLASHDEQLVEHARKLATQAREPTPHYEHVELGYNYRMSNVMAAIGIGQLHVLDERVERRRQVFHTYERLLGDLPELAFMPEPDYCRSNRWLTVMLIDPNARAAPADIRQRLETHDIEARPVWKPMHIQPCFSTGANSYPCRIVGGGVAEDIFERGLCLPSGSSLADADIERICDIVRSVLT
jgi:dTDP-4-amino-4,6-dideoxygalactose transaminase